MAKNPAYQMYAAEFAMDTMGWPADRLTCHVRFMNHQWVNGGVEDDPIQMAFIAGLDIATFTKVWAWLKRKYELGEDGLWRGRKMERVRRDQEEYKASKSAAGKAGAGARWQSDDTSDGKSMAEPMAKPCPSSSTSSSTSVSQKQKRERGTRIPTDFKVTPDHRYFALENGCPAPDDHIVKFKNYWAANGKTKLDWDATFRVWLLSERDKYGPKTLGGANGQPTKASQRQQSSFDAIRAAVDRANERATGNGNGSHEGSLHQSGSAGGDAGRDDAGLEGPDSGVRRKEVQASVIESSPTLQVLPNHGRDKGVLRSGLERVPAPVGSG